MMNLACLSVPELVVIAESDPRFQQDKLFTEMVLRLQVLSYGSWGRGNFGPRSSREVIDVRSQPTA